MAEYQVSWRDYDVTVDADSEDEAREKLLSIVRDDLLSEAEVEALTVYDVVIDCMGCRVNVVAADRDEARRNVQQYVENNLALIEEEVPHHIGHFITDIKRTATVKGVSQTDHYEIDREGHWEEGSL